MSTTFLASNYITTASQLTASSQSASELTGVTSAAAGSARFSRFGTYDDIIDRVYVVEITDAPEPVEFGTTLFRWSDTGGTTWNAENQNTIPLIPISLSHGISIQWIDEPGQPFYAGDYWKFTAKRRFSVANLLTWDRDQWYQSGLTPDTTVVTITADLGVAMQPTACVGFDHNLVSTTTVRLQGDNDVAFGSLDTDVALTWETQQIKAFSASWASARYWRLRFTVNGSLQPDIRMSHWYLGDTIAMSQSFDIGYEDGQTHLGEADPSILIHGPGPLGFNPRHWGVTFGRIQDSSGNDVERLQTLYDLTHDEVRRTHWPCFFYQDEGMTTVLAMVQYVGARPKQHRYLDRFSQDVELLEVVRTAAA